VTTNRRPLRAGVGLSLLVHAPVLLLLAGRPRTATPASEPVVAIELVTGELAPPLPEPSVRTPVPLVRPRARPTTGTTGRAARAKVAVSIERPEDLAVAASPEVAEPAGEQADPGPAPAVVSRVQPRPTAPSPARVPVVGAETARALRVYDTFPMLLAQAAVARAEVLVEVCVSDHGQVSDAVIAQGGTRSIEGTLRTAIRSWRYRPLLVNGAPTPFCHFVRLKYATTGDRS
jgi:hypothetical protein